MTRIAARLYKFARMADGWRNGNRAEKGARDGMEHHDRRSHVPDYRRRPVWRPRCNAAFRRADMSGTRRRRLDSFRLSGRRE
ncbi:hypothetical protein [Aurantimonas manganoxydans]|uniref:hypothetical protein n=1 Tax=Aurantimonas manganoxydans TaxID=651183 RepID=UPI000A61A105|nr:hypothetical protein [Aurantimonas manganoxydans]